MYAQVLFITLGIILIIIGLGETIYALYRNLILDMILPFCIISMILGGCLLWIGIKSQHDKQELIVQNEIVDTDERTVVLKELPEESSYYEFQNLSGGTKIKYLDGKELVTLNIDSYREFYDAKNQPYIEIKESKNTYGDVLETNVVIHLKELENE